MIQFIPLDEFSNLKESNLINFAVSNEDKVEKHR